MIISDLELFSVQNAIGGTSSPTSSLIIRLVAHSGHEGWGEATINWRQDELMLRRDFLLPILMGRSVFDIEELVRLKSFPSEPVRFAVEMACWDMIGRICKHPICRFLGGEYRRHVPVIARLSGNHADEITKMSLEFANQGYHWQLFPLSGKLDHDLLTLELLTDTLQNRVELRVDAAGKYSYQEMVLLLTACENRGIAVLIDPLDTLLLHEISLLQKQTDIPLGIRQGVKSSQDVFLMAQLGNLKWLMLEAQQVGSLLAMKKCAAVAEAAGIQVSVSSISSVGPLLACMTQLAASIPALSHGNECSPQQLEMNIFKESLEVSDGLLRLSHSPGIGADIEKIKLEC